MCVFCRIAIILITIGKIAKLSIEVTITSRVKLGGPRSKYMLNEVVITPHSITLTHFTWWHEHYCAVGGANPVCNCNSCCVLDSWFWNNDVMHASIHWTLRGAAHNLSTISPCHCHIVAGEGSTFSSPRCTPLHCACVVHSRCVERRTGHQAAAELTWLVCTWGSVSYLAAKPWHYKYDNYLYLQLEELLALKYSSPACPTLL